VPLTSQADGACLPLPGLSPRAPPRFCLMALLGNSITCCRRLRQEGLAWRRAAGSLACKSKPELPARHALRPNGWALTCSCPSKGPWLPVADTSAGQRSADSTGDPELPTPAAECSAACLNAQPCW